MQDGFLPDPERPPYAEGFRRRSVAGVAILVGVVLMVFGAMSVSKSVEDAARQRIPGTFVVREVSPVCDDTICRPRAGTFTSDDGAVVRTHVHLGNPPRTPVKPGDRIRAFDIGEPTEVFRYTSGDNSPHLGPAAFILLGLACTVLGTIYGWRHRKRRGPGAT